MNKKLVDTNDHVHDSSVKTQKEAKEPSLPSSGAAPVAIPVQIPISLTPSASSFVACLVKSPDGEAIPKRYGAWQASRLQPRPLSLPSGNQDEGKTSFLFPVRSLKEMPLRSRESWEMISDSYSAGTQSEDGCELRETYEEASETDARVEDERSYKASSKFRATTVCAAALVPDEKGDIERQERREDKLPLRTQLSGVPLVTKSDDDIWPSRQTQITRAQAVQEASLPTWRYKLNPLRKLGRKQRFAAKLTIAIFIVGSAVAIGVGVSGVAGGDAVQVAIKPKAIA